MFSTPQIATGHHERISEAMVGMYADVYGRGHTSATTYINGRVILCMLADSSTESEAAQMAGGEGAAVIDGRVAFQRDQEGAFTLAIEQITGRNVIAFLSANEASLSHAAEIFVLDAPADGEQ